MITPDAHQRRGRAAGLAEEMRHFGH